MPSSTPSSASRAFTLTLGALLAAALMGCAPAAPNVQLDIGDPWVRASMGADNPTAAYMTIRNRGNVADTLIAATVEGAELVEIHRSMADDSGMHQMEPVAGIDVPAGGSVTLEPGGLHLMIFGLAAPLEAGDEVLITLTFAQAGTWPVLADVRAP